MVEKKRAIGLSQNGFTVGFIGWLLPIKGPMQLLNAMKEVWLEHDDANLVFIGKGELDVDLRAAALNIGANGRVNFLGWRNDIDQIMPVFDLANLLAFLFVPHVRFDAVVNHPSLPDGRVPVVGQAQFLPLLQSCPD